MRSVAAMLTASVSIGSGVWLHGYTQTSSVAPGAVAKLISSSPLGSFLGKGTPGKSTIGAILRAKHGRLARLRAALGLGRVHPTWADPAALIILIGGVGSSVLMLLRGVLMRRRMRHAMQGAGAIPPELLRILGQFGRGSDKP